MLQHLSGVQGAELEASQRMGRGQRRMQTALEESDMLTTQSGRTGSEEAGPLGDEADMEEEIVGELVLCLHGPDSGLMLRCCLCRP